jgi:hypothetical protein
MKRASLLSRIFFCLVMVTFTAALARSAGAAPEAHILRIDPRAALSEGAPILTTVIEIVQANRLNDVLTNAGCNNTKSDDCVSDALETKDALFSPFPFPEGNARFFVTVDGAEQPTKFVSKAQWSASYKDPSVGTAWLIALDASSGMGARYNDAREVANQFVGTLGPNDIVNLIIFDDRPNQYVADSKWVTAKNKGNVIKILEANGKASESHGSSRALFDQVKKMVQNSFGDLGNTGGPNVPLHQAMVLLSNGAGRQDPGTNSLSAEAMHQYMTDGRFPQDAVMKTPLPVISIYFPNGAGTMNDFYRSNDAAFMQNIANPEIGGFFDIVRGGQGVPKGRKIVDVVKRRFDLMWIVKWRLSCIAPTVAQTFDLVFTNIKNTTVKPDASFKNVAIGIDPTAWPLDINIAQTQAEAQANPLYPGGTFRVYGDFCWGGDKGRAEAYFVPAGSKPDPNANKNDPDLAKKAMQNLIAQNMRGGAIEAGDTFVTLQVPDDEKMLEGQGDNTIARVVVYDNKAHRASGTDEKSVLALKAMKKPFNLPLILGIGGGVVVIGLLVIVLLRGGGGGKGGKRKGGAPPPAPVVAGGYTPPYQGGGSPPAGGYGGGPPPGGYGPGGYGGGGGGGYGASPDPRSEAYAAPVSPVAVAPVAPHVVPAQVVPAHMVPPSMGNVVAPGGASVPL